MFVILNAVKDLLFGFVILNAVKDLLFRPTQRGPATQPTPRVILIGPVHPYSGAPDLDSETWVYEPSPFQKSRPKCPKKPPLTTAESAQPAAPIATIATLGQHEGQSVTLRGWLYNLRASGKLLFPIFRDGTGTVQGVVPKADVPESLRDAQRPHAGVQRHRHRQGPRRQARARRLRARRRGHRGHPARPRATALPHHAQGARRRLPHGAPPPLAALAAPVAPSCACAPRSCSAARDYFDSQRLHPHRRAHPHARRLRGHLDALRDRLLRRRRPTSPSPASSTSKPPRWPSARSTASAPPSAPRSPRPAATSPSSGWSSPRSPSGPRRPAWTSPRTSSAHIVADACSRTARRSSKSSSATSRSSKRSQPPFPRITLRRGHRDAQRGHSKGKLEHPFEFGDDFGGPTRPASPRSSTARSWSTATPPRSRPST